MRSLASTEELDVECIDCGNRYTVSYRVGELWPPEACGECGGMRIVVGHVPPGNSTEAER